MDTRQEKTAAEAASYEDGMDAEIVDLANAVGKAAAASSLYLPGATAAAAEDSDSTFGPPGKRRKSNSGNDANDDDDDDDDLKPAAKPSSSRRERSSSRKKRATPKAAAVNDEDEEGEYLDNNRRHKKAKQSGKSTVANRTCPFCSKLISSKAGLKYHVDNFVCRPEACPDLEQLKKKRRRSATDEGNRNRGPLERRTCPHCSRVFTSELGCNYHIKHKVCLSQKGVSGATTVSNKAASFDLLPPGARFMTKFGIVEVVNDCREFPTGRLPPDIKKKVKAYAPLKLRKEAKNAKTHDDIASQLRARRTRINTLYQTRSPNKISTFHAYFGDDPQKIMESSSSPPIPPPAMDELPEDPLAPPNFFPDRVVECILVPDDRLRYLSTDIRTPIEARDAGQTGKTPTRLFLQRRLLMEEYNPDLSTYSCAECGGVFLSLGGMRYHCNASVCVQNSIREAEKRAARQRTVENNRLRLLANPVDKGRKRMLKTKKTRKRDTAMYPQVLISLGFELVQDDLRFTRFGNINANLEAPLVDLDPADEEDQFECLDPTEIADSLRHEWRAAQREYLLAAADQKYGSMYKGVYQSLGFKKGRKRPRSPSRVRKRKVAKAPPPAKPVPMPPIIDTQALADEINSGRYPSMSRYEGDGHFDICALCKDGGDLICCDFCRNSEHLACVRGRFTIKAPEPEDDFLCHKCIQNVQGKRNRAEKRRLMKLEREEEQRRREDEEEQLLSPGIQKGQEYPYMADQARDVNELLELLQDSQTRLKQGLATSKMNNIRRKTMECFHIEAV